MYIVVRRFLVLAALMFWLGGFTFYSAVVVPIGQEQLGHRTQGEVTRQVTNYLNLAGAVSLGVLAWDVAVSTDKSRPQRRARWLSWAAMVVALGWLVWLHRHLDDLLDAASFDRSTFRTSHRVYLWLSTIQWGCGVAYALLALGAWRREDRERRLAQ